MSGLLLGLDPAEVDVVYCYPWPGDEGPVAHLFAHLSTPGALLVCDTGEEALHIHQRR